MSTIGPAGTGLAVGPHPTIANLWVREVDPVSTNTYGHPLIVTGVIKGVSDNSIDTTTNTYAHGCLLTQVDGKTNLSGTWENVGTTASPAWQRWSDQ